MAVGRPILGSLSRLVPRFAEVIAEIALEHGV
jgi:hypothetical protein